MRAALVCAFVVAVMLVSALPQAQEPAAVAVDFSEGTIEPTPVDPGRPWGWAVRAFMDDPDRKLYNKAKAKLLRGEQVFSHTQSRFDTDQYCEVAKHYDYTWFEMQHSRLRYDEVEDMIRACPHVGATPMIRMPDARDSSMQKALRPWGARNHRAHGRRRVQREGRCPACTIPSRRPPQSRGQWALGQLPQPWRDLPELDQ